MWKRSPVERPHKLPAGLLQLGAHARAESRLLLALAGTSSSSQLPLLSGTAPTTRLPLLPTFRVEHFFLRCGEQLELAHQETSLHLLPCFLLSCGNLIRIRAVATFAAVISSGLTIKFPGAAIAPTAFPCLPSAIRPTLFEASAKSRVHFARHALPPGPTTATTAPACERSALLLLLDQHGDNSRRCECAAHVNDHGGQPEDRPVNANERAT